MAKSNEYWQKRFEAIENTRYRESKKYYDDLQKQFRMASNEIQAEISSWYARIAANNDISYSAAKRFLGKKEIEEFKWTVEEYIMYGEENAINQKWLKELENASARVHISKLEAMKLQMQQTIEKLFVEYEGGVSDFLGKTFSSGYYNTAYEIAKGTGIGVNLHVIDNEKINSFITKPWALDGKNFSDRIWTNKTKLIENLHTELTQQIVRGSSPQKAISAIAKRMDVGRNQAGNLVMTESAAIASGAQKECFKDLGVDKYEIVATLDLRTSEKCRKMDGKGRSEKEPFFYLSEYVIGQTAPPFHCRCRTCTCPFFDDEFSEGDERAARDRDGNTYYVSANMTYNEWHKKYIDSNPEEVLAEKKIKNQYADEKQYNEYIEKLGSEYVPSSLESFQDMKYTKETEYGVLKAQVKGMTYYEKAVENEPLITSSIKKIAKSNDVNILGLEHRVKAKDSYLEKIRRDYSEGNTGYEINDIIRYTYGADGTVLAEKTLLCIDDLTGIDYNTVKIKNSWLDKNNPYNGINTTVQAPNGQKFEIQYHTQESYNIKDKMHKDYEAWRQMDKSTKEAQQLRKEMFEQSRGMNTPKNIEKVR